MAIISNYNRKVEERIFEIKEQIQNAEIRLATWQEQMKHNKYCRLRLSRPYNTLFHGTQALKIHLRKLENKLIVCN